MGRLLGRQRWGGNEDKLVKHLGVNVYPQLRLIIIGNVNVFVPPRKTVCEEIAIYYSYYHRFIVLSVVCGVVGGGKNVSPSMKKSETTRLVRQPPFQFNNLPMKFSLISVLALAASTAAFQPTGEFEYFDYKPFCQKIPLHFSVTVGGGATGGF